MKHAICTDYEIVDAPTRRVISENSFKTFLELFVEWKKDYPNSVLECYSLNRKHNNLITSETHTTYIYGNIARLELIKTITYTE